MASWSFNPFTGNLDLTGSSGAVVFEGEVDTFADLPDAVGNPPVGSSYLVRTSTGVWLVNRKQAGIWIRRNNTGVRDTDWEYGGDYPVNSVNGQTGNVALTASDVGAAAASHTHTASAITDFNSAAAAAAPVQSVNGSTGAVTVSVPTASSATPSALGVASAGSSANFARADHVHAMPSAADVGLGSEDSPTFASVTLANAGTDGDNLLGCDDQGNVYRVTDSNFNLSAAYSNLGLGLVATSNSYNDLDDRPTLGSAAFDASTDFAAASHIHADATTTVAGFLSAADKTKLDGIASGAEVNVQANWAESNSGSDAFIQNKPTLAAIATSGSASDLTSGTVATARLGTGTANSTSFLRGDQTWSVVSGVTTGSVDNAVLRADGVSGSQSQSSDIVISDAVTTTQNRVAITNDHSGQTNSSIVLAPKGNGSVIFGAFGGNARGQFAVDLQMGREENAHVASGNHSICGGFTSRATGARSVALGYFNGATGSESASIGGYINTASGMRSFNGAGEGNTASSTYAATLGGLNASADRFSIHAHSAGQFAALGDAQRIRAVLRCKTTTNAAVEMALNGGTTYLTIPSGKVIFLNIKVVGSKSDGSVVATYERQYAAKNVAATSSEVFAPITIGADNAAGTTLEVATVDAGDYIRIRPTGILNETWRWVASVDAVEVAYGT